MKAGTRLAVYGAGLVVVFAAAFAAGGALVPDGVVETWTQQSAGHSDTPTPHDAGTPGPDAAPTASGSTATAPHGDATPGATTATHP